VCYFTGGMASGTLPSPAFSWGRFVSATGQPLFRRFTYGTLANKWEFTTIVMACQVGDSFIRKHLLTCELAGPINK
jgi:hypothetical protein